MKDLELIGEINNIGGLDDCMILKNNDSSGIYFFTDLDYYNINIKRLSDSYKTKKNILVICKFSNITVKNITESGFRRI